MAETRTAVAKTNDLADGEMKEVTVGETEVLLARVDGEFYATDAHCSHYGGKLAEGVLESETGCVICPLHHAVFDVTDGRDVEPPARDCLASYPVEIEGDDVVVEVSEAHDGGNQYCEHSSNDSRRFVLLGAGASASMAAETLRRNGFEGELQLVTFEEDPPYDRPNLSKDYLAGVAEPEWIPLRSESFYEEHDIELLTGRRAVDVDLDAKAVELESGDRLGYDKLLIATGADPIQLDVPGADLDGVRLLRTLSDTERIIERLDEVESAVVVGSSFIGMEAAFSLRKRELDVTVASLDSTPFEQVLGPSIGSAVQKLHEQNGVEFELGQTVERFEGDGELEAVVLEDGTRLEADLAVVGIGVRPATGFLDSLELTDDGGIEVDRALQAHQDIYAAGDVAQFPEPRSLHPIRVEHWRVANQHGKIAALNMLGEEVEYDEVPFFWTRHFGTFYKYVGHADQWEDVIIDGSPVDNDFVAFYVDGDDVRAAFGTRGADLNYIHALMRHDAMPPTSEILGGFELP